MNPSVSGASYRPQMRQCSMRILTRFGWIRGTTHVQPSHTVQHHLNPKGDQGGYIKLTMATFLGQGRTVPFLAMRRDAIALIIPDDPEEYLYATDPGATARHGVTCLLERVSVAGAMPAPESMRVSDFLTAARGFVAVDEAVVALNQPSATTQGRESVPALLVNTQHLIGVATQ